LGNIKKELLDTTSKQEYEAKKENFLRKVQEAESGLQIRTGAAKIGKIETEIQKLKKEALDEKDPVRRAKIMELIEEQGKNLEAKYRKKQELSNKFNFDPGRKVNNLINAIKKALDKKDRSSGGGGSRNPRTSRNPNNSDTSSDSESSNYSDTDDDNIKPSARKKKKESPQN
ncbi:896_t:CDS:2, partial [Ambispora gerdemannii]